MKQLRGSIKASIAAGALCLLLGTVPLAARTISVTGFAAQADGITDNTAAFQAAIDEAARTGGIATVPPGTYRFYGASDIRIDIVHRAASSCRASLKAVRVNDSIRIRVARIFTRTRRSRWTYFLHLPSIHT